MAVARPLENPSSAQEPKRAALRAHPLLALALALVAFVAIHTWWLIHFRRGYPLNTDEYGYTRIALEYADGLRLQGLSGLWDAFAAQRLQAPVAPLAAVPVLLVQRGILPALFVNLGFLVLLGLATYGIARELAGRWWGVLAAVAVLALPGTLDFSRVFVFALPATAVLAAAVYALLKSRALINTQWAIVFGALLGLSVLTRTVMIALVPGPLVAAVLLIAAQTDRRGRRVRNLTIGIAAGCAVAAIWLVNSWSVVVDYLTSAGYGAQAQEFAGGQSVLHITLDQYTYLPAALVLGAALVAAAGRVVARLRGAGGLVPRLRIVARSTAFVLFVILAEGWAALESSQNAGFGFELPLLPPIVCLAVWSMARVQRARVRHALVAALLTVSTVNVVSKADVWRGASGQSRAALPLLGNVAIANGVSAQEHILENSGTEFGPPTRRWPVALRGWQDLQLRTATDLISIARAHHRRPVAFLASRDPLFNTNSLGFALRLFLGTAIPLGQLDPSRPGDSVAAYRAQLADPDRGLPNLLVLAAPGPGEYRPAINQAYAERAARELGFRVERTFALPDGRPAKIMWTDRGPPAP